MTDILYDRDGVVADDDVDYEALASLRPRYGMYIPRVSVDLICSDPSMTDQSQMAEADINNIMLKYEKTGTVPSLDRQPMYGDFVDLPDFMESQEILRRATESFMALPARVRAQFDNDPAQFVAFAEDEKNLDQMRLWGLAKPLDEPALEPAPEPLAPGEGGRKAAEPPTQ